MNKAFDIKKLETIFSENFSSPLYSVLAEEYLKQKDFDRAYTVCKIGLENHPGDIVGEYILSKLYLLKGEISQSKALLNNLLDKFPIHLNARRLIIEILKKEKENNGRLAHHIKEFQKYFPELSTISSSDKSNKSIDSDDSLSAEQESQIKEKPNKKKKDFSIKKNMATFTLVDILVGQKHYNQALDVLSLLEKEGKSQSKIDKKRATINKHIQNESK